jgi:hypothetical protein
LDAELGSHLTSYAHSHVELRNTLAEAKAEMDAAAKAARQKVEATQRLPKSVPPSKHEEPVPLNRVDNEARPSLFAAQPQSTEPASTTIEGGGKTTP